VGTYVSSKNRPLVRDTKSSRNPWEGGATVTGREKWEKKEFAGEKRAAAKRGGATLVGVGGRGRKKPGGWSWGKKKPREGPQSSAWSQKNNTKRLTPQKEQETFGGNTLGKE